MGFFNRSGKRGSGSRRGNQGGGNSVAGDRTNLFLYLSDTEWRAQFVFADGTPADAPLGGAVILAPNNGKSFSDLGEICRRALREIGNNRTGEIGAVSIVLSDPGISLLDNLDRHFSSANVAKIRQFGAETLHCDEVSYGFSRFGPAEAGGVAGARSDQGVFGFADVAILRRYLGYLDRLAVKTVHIAPVTQKTIFDAQADPERTACGLYMGAWSTQVVICNAVRGSVTTRNLPVGLFTLVDAVARANNISAGEALQALDRRDCLSGILLDRNPNGQRAAHVPSQFERILGEPLRSLGDEIDRTLQYFDVQRIGGRPDAIELYGPTNEIQGIATWLGRKLGLEVADANATILNDFIRRPRTDGLNLLEGARSSLITLGRVSYGWDKDRFLPEHELDPDDAAEDRAAAGIISGKPVARREAPPDRRRASGLFRRRARSKEGAAQPKRGQRRPPLPAAKQKGSRAGYILLALFAFVSLYGGYKTFIEPKVREYNGLAYTYGETLRRNEALRTQKNQAEAGKPIKREVRSFQDKVLWTEKFLALGCYATRAIWLTDVFLTTAVTTVSGKPEKNLKLTIKGAVLPSTDGHLLKISEYIRRLEEDKRGLFMGDFKRITFEGATVDFEDVEEIIRFTIEGWYDKGKKRPEKVPLRREDLSMAGCLESDEPSSTARKEALLDPLDGAENIGTEQ